MNKQYKILLMGNVDTLSCNQITDETHIKDALLELGHQVFVNDESKLPEVDLILCFKSDKFGVEQIKDWKTKTEAPIWFWSFDNMLGRCANFLPIIKECDLWLGEELGRQEEIRKQELPFYWFPFHAFNPEYFYKVESEKEFDVIFLGTPYSQNYQPDKLELLKTIQGKFKLDVFGNDYWNWKNQGIENAHPPKFDKEFSELVGKSKINIAISNCQCEGYWSVRSSCILGAGGFCLVCYTPQMEKELKDNVVYFETIDDCLKKIDYYLKHDDERQEIANRGYEYANRYLTVKQRMVELMILFENRKSI